MRKGNRERLTLSDWITFLSSESISNRGNIVSLGAFVFAGLAILVAMVNTPHGIWWGIDIGLAAIGLGFLFWGLALKWGRNANKARKLLNAIMKGDLRNPLEVQNEWERFLEEQKPKIIRIRTVWDIIVKRKGK